MNVKLLSFSQFSRVFSIALEFLFNLGIFRNKIYILGFLKLQSGTTGRSTAVMPNYAGNACNLVIGPRGLPATLPLICERLLWQQLKYKYSMFYTFSVTNWITRWQSFLAKLTRDNVHKSHIYAVWLLTAPGNTGPHREMTDYFASTTN